MKLCPNGGKRCYGSPREAKRSCARTSNRFRVYRCSCGYYHVTSEVNQGRKR